MTAAIIALNSRCGCILSAIHAVALLFPNLYRFRDLLLKYISYIYRNATPKYKRYSPCFPRKEFKEEELHIDKSGAFNESFF